MDITKGGLFGCGYCKDVKKEKTPYGVKRFCEHDSCPYFDERKMRDKGINSYGEWVEKGCPDCAPDKN